MSYILEALKKSDQKRKQGDIPDLQTVHMSLPADVQQSRWPYIVIVILLMGLVFLLGWMRPWQVALNTDSPVNSPVSENKDVVARAAVEQPVIIEAIAEAEKIEPVSTEPELNNMAEKTASLSIAQQAVQDAPAVPHLEELPALLQQAIPDMAFAGHVYSSSSAQRSVIINGYAMGEGDMIVDGLRIEQITRKGVIFDYQSQLFRIDILQDWSFD